MVIMTLFPIPKSVILTGRHRTVFRSGTTLLWKPPLLRKGIDEWQNNLRRRGKKICGRHLCQVWDAEAAAVGWQNFWLKKQDKGESATGFLPNEGFGCSGHPKGSKMKHCPLMMRKEPVSERLNRRIIPLELGMSYPTLPWSAPGCRTGNGEKLSSSQAEPGQASKSAVA